MIAKRYIELIHKEIDGLNSAKESAKLKVLLQQNAEARDLYNGLVAVSEKLSKLETVEPPPNIKKIILNSIPRDKYAKKEAVSFVASLRHAFSSKPKLGYAFAFSAGLAVGLLLLIFSGRAGAPTSGIVDFYGTFVTHPPAESVPRVGQLAFDLAQVTGTVILRSANGAILVELEAQARGEIDVRFGFDRSELRFISFTNLEESPVGHLATDESSATLRLSGEARCLLVFERRKGSAARFEVRIFHSDNLIYEGTLSAGEK